MKAHLKTHDPNRSGNVKIEDPTEELLNVTDWKKIFKNDDPNVQSLVCCV